MTGLALIKKSYSSTRGDLWLQSWSSLYPFNMADRTQLLFFIISVPNWQMRGHFFYGLHSLAMLLWVGFSEIVAETTEMMKSSDTRFVLEATALLWLLKVTIVNPYV